MLSGIATTAAVELTAEEQFFVELVNRARIDPTAEADRLGVGVNEGLSGDDQLTSTPKQVLATNSVLADAADAHSRDMIDRDFFAHTNPDGVTASQRVRDAGYINARGQGGGNVAAGENLNLISAWPELDRSDLEALIEQHHLALWTSTSHRPQILTDSNLVSEIGIGIQDGIYTGTASSGTERDLDASLVTQKYGVTAITRTFITGAVFADGAEDNDFYNIGEGRGGGRVVATNVETGEQFAGEVNAVGGYNILVGSTTHYSSGSQADQEAATYRLTLEQDGESYTLDGTVDVDQTNVKADFDLSDLSADPVADPTFAGEPVVRFHDDVVRWSYFADGDWFDASLTLATDAYRVGLPGDFDGDGDTDIAVQRTASGDWDVVLLDGRDATVRTNFVNRAGTDAIEYEQAHTGDFNGDGIDDLAVYDVAVGQWHVALTGADGVTGGLANWQALGNDRAWVNSRVGDFDGDGRDDIAIQENVFGQWYFMTSNGSRFITQAWGDSVNIEIQYSAIESGDVDGDGRDELLMLNSVTGFWLVGFVNQEDTFETWARWTTEAAWTNVLVGDFDGDGRDDIAAQTGTPGGDRDGVWYVAPSVINEDVAPEQLRGRFVGQKWSDRWNPAWGITSFGAADLDGDGRADIVGRTADGGSFLVGRSTGASPLDGGSGFEFGTLAGLSAVREETDRLLVGDRVQPLDPVLPADA